MTGVVTDEHAPGRLDAQLKREGLERLRVGFLKADAFGGADYVERPGQSRSPELVDLSRGLGRSQRDIMRVIEAGRPAQITSPYQPEATQVAYRRAAYQLEASGQLQLGSQRSGTVRRLVAYPPEIAPPTSPPVESLDGHKYRRPL